MWGVYQKCVQARGNKLVLTMSCTVIVTRTATKNTAICSFCQKSPTRDKSLYIRSCIGVIVWASLLMQVPNSCSFDIPRSSADPFLHPCRSSFLPATRTMACLSSSASWRCECYLKPESLFCGQLSLPSFRPFAASSPFHSNAIFSLHSLPWKFHTPPKHTRSAGETSPRII